MIKRVLILTDGFAAPAYIPRVRHFINQLQTEHCEVIVCSEWICDDMSRPSIQCKLYEWHYYKWKGLFQHLEWLIKFIINLVTPSKERAFKNFIKQHVTLSDIDLIICSSFSTFPSLSAALLSRHYKIPLVVDLRDIAEQCPGTGYYKHQLNHFKICAALIEKYYRAVQVKRRNRALAQAAVVTTVSPWHVDQLKKYNPHVHLVYNGYDATIFKPKHIESSKFYITYTGKVYEPIMQDPTLFFEALEHLLESGKITPSDLQVRFYTNLESKKRILPYLRTQIIESCVSFHTYIPTHEIPDVLNESSILLVFSNIASKDGANGILTTKLYEAMGVEKPVLCLRSDEAILSKLIEETHCGIAAKTVEMVEEYIYAQYTQWTLNHYTHIEGNQACHDIYSRQYQGKLFYQLIEPLFTKKVD